MKSLILMSFLMSSCASSKEVGPWIERTVRTEKMDWRWCSMELDGPLLAGKGWCWQGQECRITKHVLSRDTQECRPKPYFCAHEDVVCMVLYRFPEKKLKH